jgi:hypothetical protein
MSDLRNDGRYYLVSFVFKYPQIDATSPLNIYVDEIIHVDKFNEIYFTGSRQNYSLERQVYR